MLDVKAVEGDLAVSDDGGVDVALEEVVRAHRVIDTHDESAALSRPGPVVDRVFWVEVPVRVLQLGVVQILGKCCTLRRFAG